MINNIVNRQFFVLFILSLTFSAVSGCGYTTRSMISNKFKTIYVAPFANRIDITQESGITNKYKVYRPGLETDITKTVINKFLFDGNVKPIKLDSAADLVLKSELLEFKRDAVKYTENDDVEEYRLSLVVNIALWDNRKQELIWEEKGFTGEATYFVVGATARSEDVAIIDTYADLARRIVERVVEQW